MKLNARKMCPVRYMNMMILNLMNPCDMQGYFLPDYIPHVKFLYAGQVLSEFKILYSHSLHFKFY